MCYIRIHRKVMFIGLVQQYTRYILKINHTYLVVISDGRNNKHNIYTDMPTVYILCIFVNPLQVTPAQDFVIK